MQNLKLFLWNHCSQMRGCRLNDHLIFLLVSSLLLFAALIMLKFGSSWFPRDSSFSPLPLLLMGKERKKKSRGRSETKSDHGKRRKSKTEKKDKDKKKRRKQSSSSYSSDSEDAALGAEVKLAQTIGEGFGLKPKSLKFGKQITRISDLAPCLLACVLCRATPDLTEQTIMRLGGELWEARLMV